MKMVVKIFCSIVAVPLVIIYALIAIIMHIFSDFYDAAKEIYGYIWEDKKE